MGNQYAYQYAQLSLSTLRWDQCLSVHCYLTDHGSTTNQKSPKSCSIMLTLSGPPSTPQVPDPLTDYRRRCAGPIQRYRLTLTLVTCSGTLCETV